MSNRLKLKNAPKHHIEIANGAVIVDFYVNEKDIKKCYMRMYAHNGAFDYKIGACHTYGYLMAAINQGNTRELEAFCILLWRMTQECYQDETLAKDLVTCFNARDERLMKQGAEKAKAVTDSEEMASQAFMESVVERSQMNKKEAKAALEADKQMMREILNEDKEGE
jgi:DNA-binding NtrC family response regulator|nr:MAG TPA: Protein of unknown function DUF2620 [Caudoviricetes sp.]